VRRSLGQRSPSSNRRRRECGYILLTLLLFVSLLVIASLAVLPQFAFQVRRDREEEMIHRGVQYSRAIKRYYKKFGTYPASLDALENTNHIRFLRKRYKDPITRKDFKILRMTDVKMAFGPGIAGAQPVGGATGLNAPFGANAPGQGGPGTLGATTAAGPKTAANPNPQDPNQTADQGNAATAQTDPNAPATSNASGGTSAGSSDSQSNEQKNSNSPFVTASGKPAGGSIGGTPIVGVASISKKQSIRIFNKKDHYDEWQFIYDPTSDRGGLLNAPVQPGLQQGIVAPAQGGQTAAPGGLGSSSPFSSPGMNSPASGPGTQPTGQSPQN
jgi:type II secretory pathway pseudopilin PulG